MSNRVIIANPVSGHSSTHWKYKKLKTLSSLLSGATIVGLDTTSAKEFSDCVNDAARKYEHIICAGGDGTIHRLLQMRDLENHYLSIVPMGTGNALKYAFKIPSNIEKIAQRISQALPKKMDLLRHEESKELAYLASVGIDGQILKAKNELAKHHCKMQILSVFDYALATSYTLLFDYKRPDMKLSCTDAPFKNVLSLMLMQEEYYGMGMRIAPGSNGNDGNLHVTCLQGSLLQALSVVATSFISGNIFGYRTTIPTLKVESNIPVYVQLDGEPSSQKAQEFNFSVCKQAVKWLV